LSAERVELPRPAAQRRGKEVFARYSDLCFSYNPARAFGAGGETLLPLPQSGRAYGIEGLVHRTSGTFPSRRTAAGRGNSTLSCRFAAGEGGGEKRSTTGGNIP